MVCKIPHFSKAGPWALVILFSSCCIKAILFGITLSIGFYNVEFLKYFGEPAATVSLVGAINLGVLRMTAPVVSILVKCFGCRPVAIAGGLLSATGILSMVFAKDVATLCVTYGVLAGLGFSMCFIPAYVLTGFYFKKYRPLAIGISTGAEGFGAAIMPLVIYALIEQFSWRGSCFILSGISLQIVFLGALYRPPVHLGKYEAPNNTTDIIQNVNAEISIPGGGTSASIDGEGGVINEGYIPNTGKTVNTRRSFPVGGAPKSVHMRERVFKEGNVYRNDSACSQQLTETAQNTCNITNTSLREGVTDTNDHCVEHATSNAKRDAVHTRRCSEDKAATNPSCKQRVNVSEVFKTYVNIFTKLGFILYLVSFYFYSFTLGVFFAFLPAFLDTIGIDKSIQPRFMILTEGCQGVWSVMAGILSNTDFFNTGIMHGVANIVAGIAFVSYNYLQTQSSVAILFAVVGCCFGVIFGVRLLLIIELVGTENMTDALGFVTLVSGAGYLSGPPVAGYIFDLTKSFEGMFYCALATQSIAGCVMLVRPIQRRFARRNWTLNNE